MPQPTADRSRRISGVDVCKMNECDKGVAARGLCAKHYRRLLRHGSPEYTLHAANGTQVGECDVPDCGRPKYAHGLCKAHNRRLYTNGRVTTMYGGLEIQRYRRKETRCGLS